MHLCNSQLLIAGAHYYVMTGPYSVTINHQQIKLARIVILDSVIVTDTDGLFL